MVSGLRVRFEAGRAVSVEADEGGDVLRELTRRDEGAARLGEVALVDGESRVGALDRVFYDTLLDENAASHIALGAAYATTVGDEDREMGDPAAVARQGVVQRVDQSQRAAAQAELVHQALASGPTPAA